MKTALENIKSTALSALEHVQDLKELDALRVKFLGKKGELTAILKQMGSLSAEERPVIGQIANEVRSAIEQSVAQNVERLKKAALEAKLQGETLDVTMPGKHHELGKQHPINLVLDEIKEIFLGMGFDLAQGRKLNTITTTLRRSIFQKIIRQGIPRTHFISRMILFCAHRLPTYKFMSWKIRSLPFGFWRRDVSTAQTQWTPLTPPCSTRLKALSLTRASPWRI